MHLWQIAGNNQYTLIEQSLNDGHAVNFDIIHNTLYYNSLLNLSVICSDLFMQTCLYMLSTILILGHNIEHNRSKF